MAATYRGSPVTILRPATAEDAGFIHQVLIRLSDGTEEVVAKAAISESEPEPVEVEEEAEDQGEDVLEVVPPPIRKPARKTVAKEPVGKSKKKATIPHRRRA